jgi:hypothetical protein
VEWIFHRDHDLNHHGNNYLILSPYPLFCPLFTPVLSKVLFTLVAINIRIHVFQAMSIVLYSTVDACGYHIHISG